MSNVNETIVCAIDNNKEMYDNSLAMFAALYALEESNATGDFEGILHESMYNTFASEYRNKIEDAFPWLKDESDYFGVFTIMDALEDAYCNYLDEYVYNR